MGIDLNALKMIRELEGGDNPHLLKEFIDLFFQNAPTIIQKMSQACQHKNLKELHHAAHELKSSSAYLGCNPLVELCKAIQNIQSIESDQVLINLEMLDQTYAQLAVGLQLIRKNL